MGQWFVSIETLRRTLPRAEPVALIATARDAEAAVFANYYLYPIRTRLFAGRDGYRDAAPDPTRPKTIVAFTAGRAERTTYDVIRDRDLRAGQRVVVTPHLSEPLSRFILPIAASIDGPAPETFVIEATIMNPNSVPSDVRVAFLPRGMVRTIRIAPGATVSYYDFVHQLFGVMENGWIDAGSTQPLRTAFYFVNRGRGDATLLPNVTGGAMKIPSGPLYRDSKLFVLNPYWIPTVAIVDGEVFPMKSGDFMSRSITAVPKVGGDVYAYVATREMNGKTDFLWPTK